MRIFTAIPLPERIKNKVREITCGRLSVSYVNTANLHITLNFLGELTDDELRRVKLTFSGIVQEARQFPVAFDRLVKFHQQIHLTLLPNPALTELQEGMQKIFQAAGFTFSDRQYYPHVKLANLHMDHVMNPERKIEHFPHDELAQLNFVAERVVLYESKLLLHHAHYTELLTAVLQN